MVARVVPDLALAARPLAGATPGIRPGIRAGHRGLLPVAAAALLGVALGTSVTPRPADAQLGRLKRLVSRPPRDSAVRTAAADSAFGDSAAARTTPAGVPAGLSAGAPAPTRSRLARAATAAQRAGRSFEAVTGVSATDAAMAATGVGVGALAAKKLGVDPSRLASQAAGRAAGALGQRAAQSQIGRGLAAMPPGFAGVIDATQRAGMARAAVASGAVPGSMPLAAPVASPPDQAEAQALAALQQDMAQVTTAAAAGDARALARLQAWQAIALRYQPEIMRATLAAQGGDAAALRTLERLHRDMLRDWGRATR